MGNEEFDFFDFFRSKYFADGLCKGVDESSESEDDGDDDDSEGGAGFLRLRLECEFSRSEAIVSWTICPNNCIMSIGGIEELMEANPLGMS